MSRNTVLSTLVLLAAAGIVAIKMSRDAVPVQRSESSTTGTKAEVGLAEDIRHELEIDIPLASEFGSDADIKRRYQLEDEVAAELGDHGVVDGGDMGDGFMGIFVVEVSDLPLAVTRVKAVLARHNLLATASVLHWEVNLDGEEVSDALLAWPPSYEGVFARWFWPEATNCEANPAEAP